MKFDFHFLNTKIRFAEILMRKFECVFDKEAEAFTNVKTLTDDSAIDTDGNAVIYGDIVNRGYSTADSITAVLRKGSPDGEIIDSLTINEELKTLDLATVSFTVPFADDEVYYVELDQTGQNSDFIVMESDENDESEEGIIFSNNSILVNSSNDVSAARLITALHQGEKFVEAKTQSVSLVAGENTFNNPITDYKDADTMKIMVWDSKKWVPLFDACVVKLK